MNTHAVRATRTTCIRTVWILDTAHTEPRVVRGTVGIDRDGNLTDLPDLPDLPEQPTPLRSLRGEWLAFLVHHAGSSFVVQPHAAQRTDACSILRNGILRNGAPLAGGLAPACHGDWLTHGAWRATAGAGLPRRLWLSAEGPMRASTAVADGAIDAMTLDPIEVGSPVVACDCGAVHHLDTWRSRRRCAVCGHAEDGVYRRLPPAVAADVAAAGGLR